jgi:hypothetical protein
MAVIRCREKAWGRENMDALLRPEAALGNSGVAVCPRRNRL